MKLFTKRGAITAFYYLLAADGEMGEAELEKLDEIGKELDADAYKTYKDTLSALYDKSMTTAIEPDDTQDILLEGIDAALSEAPQDGEEGLLPRHLLWDMLVMASCDGEYHPNERRLIKHVARVSGIEKSVFLEMEQLIQANASLARELSWLSQSDRPYAEIHPLINELEHRQAVLLGEAKALIEDEAQQPPEALQYKPDLIDTAKQTIEDKIAPISADLGEKASKTVSSAKERLAPVSESIGRQGEKLWRGIKGLGKKKGSASETPTEPEEHEEGEN